MRALLLFGGYETPLLMRGEHGVEDAGDGALFGFGQGGDLFELPEQRGRR